MSEDRMKILKMIENGTITAEDGMKLLKAVESSESRHESTEEEIQRAIKGVRINVYDPRREKKVDITLPAGIFKFFGVKYIKDIDSDIDISGVLEAIKSGEIGELMNITTDDGHRVIISVE